jgi:hypothetical protein
VVEAFEFLLTGDTVRRTLLGGERSEYNDSLRCAHHPEGGQVQVSAGIIDDGGVERTVVRTLDNDLGRGQDCSSTLTIDGTQASDLSTLGIVLAEPPLRAPVLFQHSIRYALTARPTDRLAYFKALLEMADLDALTNALTATINSFSVVPTQLERDLDTAQEDDSLRPSLAPLRATAPSTATIEAEIRQALAISVMSLCGEDADPRADLAQLGDTLEASLDKHDQRRFDFQPWRPGTEPSLATVQLASASSYSQKAREVDTEAERLRVLFEAVLAVPAYSELEEEADCPVCGTEDALTPDRIGELRERVAAASGLRRSQLSARTELATLKGQLQSAKSALAAVVPAAATMDEPAVGSVSRQAASILGEQADLGSAHQKATALADARTAASDCVDEAIASADEALEAIERIAPIDVDSVKRAVATAATAVASVATARTAFIDTARVVLSPLRDQLASQSGTASQRALLRVARGNVALGEALRKRHAVATVKREYEAAKRDIEQAKLAVLNAKFAGMSAEIGRWWKLLRPDEPVDFLKAAPRGQGLRGVALEAALHKSDGSHHTRDALGVFSDSQLNALGLSAFLARASLQQTPIIVLDDPVQAGDDAHRDTFIDLVIPALIAADFQVLITTYDHHLNKLLTAAQPLDGFQVSLDEPADGSVVVKGSHSAQALLRDAKEYLGEGQAIRATAAGRLRVAAEAVAKEVLVAKRSAQGDRVSLADYTGKTLEGLVPLLKEHLDDQEYRWWTMVSPRLSPGAHDDAPPERNTLTMVYNGLKKTLRDHL